MPTYRFRRAAPLLVLTFMACGESPMGPVPDEGVEIVEGLTAKVVCPTCNEDELDDLNAAADRMKNSGCVYATALGNLYDEFMASGMIDKSDGWIEWGGDHGEYGMPHGGIGIDVTIGYNVLDNPEIDSEWITHTVAEELMHHFWTGQDCPESGPDEDCHQEGPGGGPGINEIANSCGGDPPLWPQGFLNE